MKYRAGATIAVAAMLGAMIWLLSPWATGREEPWDADGLFYFGALVITGLIAGAVSPKPLWAHYFGGFIGQLGYALLFLEAGPLIVVGAGFLLAYCLLFAAAAFVAGLVRTLLDARQTAA